MTGSETSRPEEFVTVETPIMHSERCKYINKNITIHFLYSSKMCEQRFVDLRQLLDSTYFGSTLTIAEGLFKLSGWLRSWRTVLSPTRPGFDIRQRHVKWYRVTSRNGGVCRISALFLQCQAAIFVVETSSMMSCPSHPRVTLQQLICVLGIGHRKTQL